MTRTFPRSTSTEVCDHCDGDGEIIVLTDDNVAKTLECPKCDGYGQITLNPVEYFKQERGARVVLALHCVRALRHHDVRRPRDDYHADTDRWDTSFVGFIFDTPEKVKECIGDDATDDQIKKALEQEVKVYAIYLEGDVTWYRVDDEETNYGDSCGGYVGDTDYCESECFGSMESAIVKRLAENEEKAHWAARDTITQ